MDNRKKLTTFSNPGLVMWQGAVPGNVTVRHEHRIDGRLQSWIPKDPTECVHKVSAATCRSHLAICSTSLLMFSPHFHALQQLDASHHWSAVLTMELR